MAGCLARFAAEALAAALVAGLSLGSASCTYADASQLDFSGLVTQDLCKSPAAGRGLVFGVDGEGYVSVGSSVFRFVPDAEQDGAPDVTLVPWAETGAPRGHAILAGGDHLLCDGARLLRLSADGARRDVLVATGLTAPRDLCLAPGGEGVFVVDGGSLLHVSLATGDAVAIDAALEEPVAVALSPDERSLYVAESASGRVLAYDLVGAEPAGSSREFAMLPPGEGPSADLCVDSDGFLWVARGNGIDILGADGRAVARIPTPGATSLAFGDASLRVLFFAGPGSDGGGVVGRSFVGVRGLALPAQREQGQSP